MEYDSSSLRDLFENNRDKKLILPNFQRSYVWKEQHQKTMLASFILKLPVGNILILNGKANEFLARDLCFSDEITVEGDCQYLLDGQQRLSTLKIIFSDLFSQDYWEDIFDRLNYNLRCRFFIDVKQFDEIDLFNYKELKFDESKILTLEPGQIEDLIVRKQIQKKDRDKWFHPALEAKKEKKSELIKGAAEEGLIPLFELFQPKEKRIKKPVYLNIVKRIASKRIDDLQLELEGNDKKIIELLEDIEEDIAEILNKNDSYSQRKLASAWMELSLSWSKDVSNFLEGLLDNQVAQIILPSREISRAFAIFEVINKGGTPLNEYDLIVAKAARNRKLQGLTPRIIEEINKKIKLNTNLTHALKSKAKPKEISLSNMKIIDDKEPSKQFKNQFLNLLSIFSHTEYGETTFDGKKVSLAVKSEHLKRSKILALTTEVTIT